MPDLLEFDLSFNEFKHIKDIGIWRQCYLEHMTASYNHFDMEMVKSPENVSGCSQHAMEWLDLHGSLNGTIPEPLGRLANLRGIDLSRSRLTGIDVEGDPSLILDLLPHCLRVYLFHRNLGPRILAYAGTKKVLPATNGTFSGDMCRRY
ncbi:hypothetical protein L1887_14458 [Cichorium endivia]|nr:hypothetical protein L1887_14458 [Cichorium endivia]